MHLIYLHGFLSNSHSIKGGQLRDYCQQHAAHIQVHTPDLNCSPQQVISKLEYLIATLERVVLVGSSLGGFYATYLVAKYNVPAVLINPAMQPWELFQQRFQAAELPLLIHPHWSIDQAQLDDLRTLALPVVQHANKILLLLQQGDEVLDYRNAQRYYTQAAHGALQMLDAGGNHAMDDFIEKIHMLLQFLSDCFD